MKKCIKCQQEKEFSEFHRQTSRRDGYKSVCKLCRVDESFKYNEPRREELNKKARLYNIQNPDKNSKYYKSRPEYFKIYRETHKHHYAEWRRKNRKRLNLYLKNKRNNEPLFKLLCGIRSRVSTLIRRNSKSRVSLSKKLLGCSMDEFKTHLESKFIDGMSWDNYGKWHLDHIIPCSSFDLSKIKDQKKCFHYTNLQPLWAIDNLKKGNRFL